jgi:metal-responsive CopG/Arc/MetJ family transcriptional regulator
MKSSTYTSTLPADLMEKLNSYATRQGMQKNKVIEKALRRFFDEARKEEYTRSFQLAKGDQEMMTLAEEGMEEYLRIIDKK